MAQELLVIPLDDTVVFPNMTVSLAIDVGDDDRGAARPQHEEDVRVGRHDRRRRRDRCACRAAERRHGRGPPRHPRARPAPATTASCALRWNRTRTRSPRASRPPSSSASTAPWSKRSSRSAAPTRASASSCARSRRPGTLADTAGYSPDLEPRRRRSRCSRRSTSSSACSSRSSCSASVLTELQVRRRIRDDIAVETEKQQREYFLRRQMDSIRKELGDDDASVIEEYAAKHRGGRACPKRCASRSAASCAGSSAWASRAARRR